jgi:hypothetical protein
MIKVETEKFQTSIDQWVKKAKGRTRELAVEFVQDLNEAVVEATPVITGFLRASWYARLNGPPSFDGSGDPVARLNLVGAQLKLGDVFHAVNGAAYAWYVEYGTAAHEIVPVERLALHWVKDGYDIFSKKVNHPGTPPRAFVRGTLARAHEIAERSAAKVAARD